MRILRILSLRRLIDLVTRSQIQTEECLGVGRQSLKNTRYLFSNKNQTMTVRI